MRWLVATGAPDLALVLQRGLAHAVCGHRQRVACVRAATSLSLITLQAGRPQNSDGRAENVAGRFGGHVSQIHILQNESVLEFRTILHFSYSFFILTITGEFTVAVLKFPTIPHFISQMSGEFSFLRCPENSHFS